MSGVYEEPCKFCGRAIGECCDPVGCHVAAKDAKIARLTELVKRGRALAQLCNDEIPWERRLGDILREARAYLEATKDVK